MQESTSPETSLQWHELLGFAGRMIYGGTERAAFMDSFRRLAPSIAPDALGKGRMPPEDAENMAGALGFAIWRAMPNPNRNWRPAPASLSGRNEPCYCGSGRKFKRCCAALAVPTGMFEDMNLLRYVLDPYPAARFADIARKRLDPLALADTARQWQVEGEAQRAAQLLEPLFANQPKLDARDVDSFDALMDAWLALDRPRKRKALVEALLEHPDAELAAAARQRKVTMLADQDDWDGAWALFQSSLRRTPDHPQFAQLEVTLLMMQGREGEARARATFWAQRLRNLEPGYADYADAILQMAHDPDRIAAFDEITGSLVLDSLNESLRAAPVPAIAYTVCTDTPEIMLQPTRELERIENLWKRRFPVEKPRLTMLDSDPGAVLDDAATVAEFLRRNPLAWQSFEILDDLALAAYSMSGTEAAGMPWFALQRRLGARAEELLCSLAPPAFASPKPSGDEAIPALLQLIAGSNPVAETLPWAFHQHRPYRRRRAPPAHEGQNRPALRLIALQIDARMFIRPADPRIPELMAWLIRLNPNDNHGYRSLLAQRWLRTSQPQAALALMDRYPGDVGTAPVDRMLALVMLGRTEEAEAVLAAEGNRVAEVCRGLLARSLRRPREVDEEFVAIGGRAEAWTYRQDMRTTWERTGALRWLAAQPQPKALPKAKSNAQPKADPRGRPRPMAGRSVEEPARDGGEPASGTAVQVQVAGKSTGDAGRERYAQLGGDLVRVHGILVASALAPDIVSPNVWISLILQSSGDAAPAFTDIDDANRVLAGIMAWYNLIVLEIGPAARSGPRVGVQSRPRLDEQTSAAVSRWAGGFVDCVKAEPAAWRRLGTLERSRQLAPLRKMAQRAPLSAAEKSDPSRIRDRTDDDAPLLSLVDDSDPVELLAHALNELAGEVGRLRSLPAARRR